LPRKLDKLSPGLTTQYSNAGLRITSVEYIGEKETKCIAIDDPTHLYITDDFIVTHNTTIINALTYAVYDKPVSDISKDNLVNNINKKHMEVVVTFIASDNKTYTIKRARKSKAGAAGNTVFLYKDGEDVTLNSVANTNAEIERIVGIPYELFVRIIVFSASQTPFLDLPLSSPSQANQTDVIEELFGLTELSAKAAVLKEHNKETELQIKIAQVKIDTLNGEHARYQQLIESTKKRIVQWDVQNTSTITQLNKKLNRVVSIDVNEQQNLHNALKDINGALQTAITDQRQLRTRIQQQRQIHDKATVDLTHLHDEKCPYCFQQFADSINKIPETESLIKNSNDTLQTLADELTAMKSVIDKLEFDQAGVKNRITVDDIDEIIQIRSEVDSIRAKIEELTSTVNPYIEPLDELEGANLEKIDYDEINKLKIEVEHQRFLLKLLTKKDSFVRKSLLNKNIPYLNTRLQHYLTNLGLPHKVEFTHEMTASISQFSRGLDFGNLSAGQRARVNIALSFAFRDVLEHLHTRINICMLDEVLDVGLDNIGVQMAARLLKRKARDEKLSLYIISHRDELDSAFDNKITVQLSKGFSYIKTGD
jgi:DNA repair exonuclease SbcCD ATPase subunit